MAAAQVSCLSSPLVGGCRCASCTLKVYPKPRWPVGLQLHLCEGMCLVFCCLGHRLYVLYCELNLNLTVAACCFRLSLHSFWSSCSGVLRQFATHTRYCCDPSLQYVMFHLVSPPECECWALFVLQSNSARCPLLWIGKRVRCPGERGRFMVHLSLSCL